jgi:hypothetical protein
LFFIDSGWNFGWYEFLKLRNVFGMVAKAGLLSPDLGRAA